MYLSGQFRFKLVSYAQSKVQSLTLFNTIFKVFYPTNIGSECNIFSDVDTLDTNIVYWSVEASESPRPVIGH